MKYILFLNLGHIVDVEKNWLIRKIIGLRKLTIKKKDLANKPKTSFMGKLASIIIFILLITFGCQNSNPTESSKGNIKKTLDSKEIDYTCLELSFIEDLESSWESSYKDSSLPLKGFVRIQSGPVENGHEIVFENKQQKNKLKISKLKYGYGEESFYVEYL